MKEVTNGAQRRIRETDPFVRLRLPFARHLCLITKTHPLCSSEKNSCST